MLKEAMLWETTQEKGVHCYLCAHHCRIAPGKYGLCAVRQNRDGTLYTCAYGTTIAENVDPVEKKPLFHFLPGSTAFSIAAVGCNFKCGFCQNWQISQAQEAEKLHVRGHDLSPDDAVKKARAQGCESIAYTYTEPTIFFEYARETAERAKQEGLFNVFVTNGYMTPETIEAIRPCLDAANIDLKYFDDAKYRAVCRGRLAPVLETIRRMHGHGIWIEVTTLVIPGQNDSREELEKIASFLAATGREIPWHISLFHPEYRFAGCEATSPEKLQEAWEIGKEAGLRYVYRGNVAGEENTHCYHCGELLIRRFVFNVVGNRLKGNRCPRCNTVIDGRMPTEQQAGDATRGRKEGRGGR